MCPRGICHEPRPATGFTPSLPRLCPGQREHEGRLHGEHRGTFPPASLHRGLRCLVPAPRRAPREPTPLTLRLHHDRVFHRSQNSALAGESVANDLDRRNASHGELKFDRMRSRCNVSRTDRLATGASIVRCDDRAVLRQNEVDPSRNGTGRTAEGIHCRVKTGVHRHGVRCKDHLHGESRLNHPNGTPIRGRVRRGSGTRGV